MNETRESLQVIFAVAVVIFIAILFADKTDSKQFPDDATCSAVPGAGAPMVECY